MTWLEFKTICERKGVTDSMKIDMIDLSGFIDEKDLTIFINKNDEIEIYS